jgi:hypothetical protein
MLGIANLMPDCWLEVSLHQGSSCYRPTLSKVFLGPRANAELVLKLLLIVILKISSYTNVILTFEFDFGLDHNVHGGYGRGRPT